MSATGTENMEGSESIHNTKISDSGYANSCTNSKSQRSGSSKTHHSGSSGAGSSGCSGTGNTQPDAAATALQQSPSKHAKDKDRKTKEKELKTQIDANATGVLVDETRKVKPCPSAAAAVGTTNTTRLETETSCYLDEPSDRQPIDKNDDFIVKEETQASQESIRRTDSIQSPCFLPGPSPATPLDDAFHDGDGEKLTGSIHVQSPGTTTPVASRPPNMEDGFRCIISMHDGVVLFTTPSITHSLGFPKNMWIGRSFIDFVHPKDRATFASQITSKVAVPLGAFEDDSRQKSPTNALYVMLRKYRGLKSTGFAVTGTAVNYEPYRLVLTFREALQERNEVTPQNGRNILLIITATPVKSIYKTPNENFNDKELKFSTIHKPCGKLNYVDGNSVEFLGYLPQDILERSIMELYHPEDMPIVKQAYEKVMLNGQSIGATFTSPSYRFLAQNGCYIVLQTEWTSFVNPWSRMLELVIGNHRVLEGPFIPDVFTSNEAGVCHETFSNELQKTAEKNVEDILQFLKEPVAKPSDKVSQEVSKRCQMFASLMEDTPDEVAQPELTLNLLKVNSELTFSEQDSVMLGEISPHHEYFDSKSSSETPPSYHQLNYNDNLYRFFNSHPIMNVEESPKMDSSGGTHTETVDARTNVSPNGQFSGSGEGSNDSSERNGKMPKTTPTSSNGPEFSNNFQPPALTEEMLCLHDEDMQKAMLKKHREARTLARCSEKKKGPPDKAQPSHVSHGLKRGHSNSWEGENHKTFKHQHNQKPTANPQNQSLNLSAPPNPTAPLQATSVAGPNEMNAPNTGTTGTPQPAALTYRVPRNGDQWQPFSNMMPTLYYIPSAPPPTPPSIPGSTPGGVGLPRLNTIPIPYIPDMMYHQPMQLYQPSLYYSPMMYQAMPFQPVALPSGLPNGTRNQPPQNLPPPVQQAAQPSASQLCQINRPTEPTAATGTATMVQTGKQYDRPTFSKGSSKVYGSFTGISNGHRTEEQKGRNVMLEDNNRKVPTARHQASEDADESTFSSLASSFLRTENSSESIYLEKKASSEMTWDSVPNKRRPGAPWLENVNQTTDWAYRYKISDRSAKDALSSDLVKLKDLKQPTLVNDQLGQLYLDLELQGLSVKLSLSETTSGSSSDDCETLDTRKITKRNMKYNKLQLIYEENAPFPPSTIGP
ncbi:period circadian protein isoform X2 [Malaya genurostris]|uniref:period circadian protein isoform X2 n=1 Tax=Malaya genurostris TaxID=325434 RepID=UPI0026F3BD9E|nr:period circadian protein isoform X2 [Malaya genurostris]